MKLYTEEQVKQIVEKSRETGLTAEYIMLTVPSIELPKVDENTSDGYHTFKELYEFRKVYNAALFNQWGKYTISKPEDKLDMRMYDVHKSWRHHDGELCFGGGWFIVVAHLPEGQISNHYEAKDWDLFKIPEREKATYPFDGHTPKDVLTRLKSL